MQSSDDPISERSLAIGEANTSVSLTSFGTIMDTFFIGLLLTGSVELQLPLRVPLAYLFISLLGFLYSTLIYANASGPAARADLVEFDRQMDIANSISEFWGFYFASFAFPLVILVYSPGPTLAVVVLVSHIIGFVFYHVSGYSILERNFGTRWTYYLSLSLLTIYVISFTFALFEYTVLYHLSSLLLVSIIMVAQIGSYVNLETF